LLDVHVQLKTAGSPEHRQMAVLLASTELGPPVQCFFRRASDFVGLKLNALKSGVYPASVA